VVGAANKPWSGVESAWRWLSRRTIWIRDYAQIIAFVLGGAAVVLAAAHSADFPSAEDWKEGEPLPIAQITAVAGWLLAQLGILVGDFRSRKNEKLVDACREVAAFVDDKCPPLPLRHVGVRIWTIGGPPWARYLKRGPSFLLSGERSQTGIRWVKGKGVVGIAWEKRRNEIQDLAALRAKAPTSEAYEALDEAERLGLGWDEFQQTPNYQAVFATPLYSRVSTSGDPPVRGILAIDLLTAHHFEQLKAATEDPEFEGVVGTCENALTPK
jgi:hypothetical protein